MMDLSNQNASVQVNCMNSEQVDLQERERWDSPFMNCISSGDDRRFVNV